MGNTNTIGRAELAAITAAILHGNLHIATDGLSSLHQIRKQLLYPELHRHHVRGDIFEDAHADHPQRQKLPGTVEVRLKRLKCG